MIGGEGREGREGRLRRAVVVLDVSGGRARQLDYHAMNRHDGLDRGMEEGCDKHEQ